MRRRRSPSRSRLWEEKVSQQRQVRRRKEGQVCGRSRCHSETVCRRHGLETLICGFGVTRCSRDTHRATEQLVVTEGRGGAQAVTAMGSGLLALRSAP